MKNAFLTVIAMMGIATCSCNSKIHPKVINWDFKNGMQGWETLHPGVADIVKTADVTFLTLKNLELHNPPRYSGGMWTHVNIGRGQSQSVSLLVAAKTDTPAVSLNMGITCQTGRQDGDMYGVLTAEESNEPLTAEWATYKMTLDIPEGTRELEFAVGINPPDVDASIDIRKIKCLIDGKKDEGKRD